MADLFSVDDNYWSSGQTNYGASYGIFTHGVAYDIQNHPYIPSNIHYIHETTIHDGSMTFQIFRGNAGSSVYYDNYDNRKYIPTHIHVHTYHPLPPKIYLITPQVYGFSVTLGITANYVDYFYIIWGDGKTTKTINHFVSHKYDKIGTYHIIVRAVKGNKSTSKGIKITLALPKLPKDIPGYFDYFLGTKSVAVAALEYTSYSAWDFGDGFTIEGVYSYVHEYDQAGAYVIKHYYEPTKYYQRTVSVSDAGQCLSGGQGTYDDPIIICSPDDWTLIEGSDKIFTLGGDIDFKGGKITPIKEFYGSLYGAGCAIKNAVLEDQAETYIAPYQDADYIAYQHGLYLIDYSIIGKEPTSLQELEQCMVAKKYSAGLFRYLSGNSQIENIQFIQLMATLKNSLFAGVLNGITVISPDTVRTVFRKIYLNAYATFENVFIGTMINAARFVVPPLDSHPDDVYLATKTMATQYYAAYINNMGAIQKATNCKYVTPSFGTDIILYDLTYNNSPILE